LAYQKFILSSLDQILDGARFSTPVQPDPGAHPASSTMGTRSSWGRWVNWLVHVIDHPPSSSLEVKERGELYLYSPSGTLLPVLV
jgi:hypothetical protein